VGAGFLFANSAAISRTPSREQRGMAMGINQVAAIVRLAGGPDPGRVCFHVSTGGWSSW